jgi:HSP20 family protein
MWDIVRWDPFRDMERMRGELDRMFTRTRTTNGGTIHAPWSPVSDVIETDDAIVITAELPGVKDDDVDIEVQDGMLIVKGERSLEDEVSKDRYYHLERSYGSFERTFRLPEGVKEEDIKAGVAYGVLRVTIPKPKASEAKRIPISANA